jgi:hypothetical protein
VQILLLLIFIYASNSTSKEGVDQYFILKNSSSLVLRKRTHFTSSRWICKNREEGYFVLKVNRSLNQNQTRKQGVDPLLLTMVDQYFVGTAMAIAWEHLSLRRGMRISLTSSWFTARKQSFVLNISKMTLGSLLRSSEICEIYKEAYICDEETTSQQPCKSGPTRRHNCQYNGAY